MKKRNDQARTSAWITYADDVEALITSAGMQGMQVGGRYAGLRWLYGDDCDNPVCRLYRRQSVITDISESTTPSGRICYNIEITVEDCCWNPLRNDTTGRFAYKSDPYNAHIIAGCLATDITEKQ